MKHLILNKAYSREEIAEFTGVSLKNSSGYSNEHFARDINNRLSSWGYTVEKQKGKNYLVTKIPETMDERIGEILYRAYGFNKKTPIHDLGIYLCLMFNDSYFARCPCFTRENLLREYGVITCEKTLSSYAKKLQEHNILVKVKNPNNRWKSEAINELKIQSEYNPDNYEEKNRRDKYWAEFNDLKKEGLSTGEAKIALWGQNKICYYTPNQYHSTAFIEEKSGSDNENMRELQDILKEYYEKLKCIKRYK